MTAIPKPIPEAQQKAYALIASKLRQFAADTLYFYSEPMDPKDLYRALIPEHAFQTMYNASLLMPKLGRWNMDNLSIMTHVLNPPMKFEYSLNYNVKTRRTQWLWPEHINSIVPDNELGQHLLPVIDLAIQWQTTLTVFEMFHINRVPIAVTVHMLPWLRFVARTLYSDSNDPHVFRRMKQYVEAPEPRYWPGVSKWFGQVCRYGSELVSLHSIIIEKNAPKPNGTVTMIPILSDNLIEDGLDDHFNEFHNELMMLSPRRNDKGIRDETGIY